MTELSQKILQSYQMRKTKPQKTAFIELMRQYYPDLRVEENGKNRNLVLGDIQNANLVLTAHYDTCAAGLFPNIVMPYRKVLKFGYTMLAILPMVLAMLAAILLLKAVKASVEVQLLGGLLVYYALFFGKYFLGKPNPHTANDNTSGIITLIEMLDRLAPVQRERIAVVFFDNEEYGCVGSKAFYKAHKAEFAEKLLLNFDCVADGDTFLLVCAELAQQRYGKLLEPAFPITEDIRVVIDSKKNADHSSDHKHFPGGVAVSAMHESKWLGLHFSRIHTVRDTVFEEKNIAYLVEAIMRLEKML